MIASNWRHDDLAQDLAAHLRSVSDRMVWTDMQLGPAGSPRPDVFTLTKSYVKPMPLAYECKISVADFRRDVTAGKWQSYLSYAAGVVFAAPGGLLGKCDVPDGCGLVVRGPDGWRTLKGPTLRVPRLPQDMLLKLLIDGVDRLRTVNPAARAQWASQQRALKEIGDRFGRTVATAIANAQALEETVKRRTDEARRAAKEIIEQAEAQAEEAKRVAREVASSFGLDPDDPHLRYSLRRAVQDRAQRLLDSGGVAARDLETIASQLAALQSRVTDALAKARPPVLPAEEVAAEEVAA